MRYWYDRWSSAVSLTLVAAFSWVAFDSVIVALIVSLAAVAGAVWWSPLRPGRHVDHADAQSEPGVVVYWKPGCWYCAKLKHDLDARTSERVTWVNIWRDRAAAAFVAGLNHGDELTPTVVADGERIDADADAVATRTTAR